MKQLMCKVWFTAASLTLLALLSSGRVSAQGAARTQPWDPEPARLFESLPVQDGGRIKPMHTYAGFMLLRLHGKRSITTPGDERLTPVEWLLDTLFDRPGNALLSRYPIPRSITSPSYTPA